MLLRDTLKKTGKAAVCQLENVPQAEAKSSEGADIIDLTELLKRSLKGAGKTRTTASAPAKKGSASKPASQRKTS